MFWRRKKSPLQEAGQTTDLVDQVPSREESIDAEAVLLAMSQRGDVTEILQMLDAHLEAIQQQGHEKDAHQLIAWIEDQLQQKKCPAMGLALLGSVYQRLHKLDQAASLQRALELYQEALKQYQVASEQEGTAVILNNMGNACVELAAFDRDYFRQAIPLLEEALQFYEEKEDPSCRALICMTLGEAYAGLEEEGPDHFELARESYERAWALFERGGAREELAEAQGRLGDVQVELGAFYGEVALEKAVRHYRNALGVYMEQNQPEVCGVYQARLAEAYIGLSNMEREHLRKGMRAYERALEMFEKSGNARARADTCMELARLHEVLKDEAEGTHLSTAVELYLQALQIYQEFGLERERGALMQALARIYLDAGHVSALEDVQQAVICLEEASRIYLRENLAAEYQAVQEDLRQARLLFGNSPSS